MIVKLILLNLSLKLTLISAYSTCELHRTCGECIRDPNDCRWCAMERFTGNHRCNPFNDTSIQCDDIFTENPVTTTDVSKNDTFSSTAGNVVQIKPQQYKVNIRPGNSADFEFSFKGADNYPADLYFLIDASTSMKSIKNIIANQSTKIYEEMQKHTSDIYLGMGTFIDKNAFPYVRKLNYTHTYSYRNHLKLTNNAEKFKEVVNDTPLGRNHDDPEAGLEALAQVMVCQNETGWRPESRKIVIFFTDQISHSAGDGKWAGIFEPYDGKCYTENGTYTKELEMDYPSISIIKKLASDHEIAIIFIVDNKYKDHYKNLNIKGSKCIPYYKTNTAVIFGSQTSIDSQLEKSLTNIYEEMTRNIKLKVSMTPEDRKHVRISFNPDCGEENNNEHKDCKVNRVEEKTFRGSIKLLQYYGKDSIPIDVTIKGIKERLTLSVNVIKDCDCETNESKIINGSEYCNHGGVQKCGNCECNPERYGDKCVCTVNSKNSSSVDSRCKPKGGEEAELCNGRGSCECGICKCLEGFQGDYCECNMNANSCTSQCNGHGECVCGTCACADEWTGDTCDCSKAQCKEIDGVTCNNRGKCECGNCVCDDIKRSWDARIEQNEDCIVLPYPERRSEQCRLLDACALCHHDNYTDCSHICDRHITVNVTKSLTHADESFDFTCDNVRAKFGCYTRYSYRYKDHEYGIELLVQTERSCNETYYVLGGVFLLTLILIGVGTLVAWKLLTDARDRREYERFARQHASDAAGACVNPIYEPATTTFTNPAFRKRSVDFR